MLIGWPGGSWESTAVIVGLILGSYAVVLWLGTIVWTYRDIRERTRDGLSQAVAVLLVVAFNLPGFFLYLVLRPHETLSEAYERRLETQAFMREFAEQRHSCSTCQRSVREDFLLCPYCRTRLQVSCAGCARPLALNWSACPYCGAQGPQPVVSAAVAQAPHAARAAPAAHSPAAPAPRGESSLPATNGEQPAAPAPSTGEQPAGRPAGRRRSDEQPAQASASSPRQAGPAR